MSNKLIFTPNYRLVFAHFYTTEIDLSSPCLTKSYQTKYTVLNRSACFHRVDIWK